MKAGREHRVPLTDAALKVLRSLIPLRNPAGSDWVSNTAALAMQFGPSPTLPSKAD